MKDVIVIDTDSEDSLSVRNVSGKLPQSLNEIIAHDFKKPITSSPAFSHNFSDPLDLENALKSPSPVALSSDCHLATTVSSDPLKSSSPIQCLSPTSYAKPRPPSERAANSSPGNPLQELAMPAFFTQPVPRMTPLRKETSGGASQRSLDYGAIEGAVGKRTLRNSLKKTHQSIKGPTLKKRLGDPAETRWKQRLRSLNRAGLKNDVSAGLANLTLYVDEPLFSLPQFQGLEQLFLGLKVRLEVTRDALVFENEVTPALPAVLFMRHVDREFDYKAEVFIPLAPDREYDELEPVVLLFMSAESLSRYLLTSDNLEVSITSLHAEQRQRFPDMRLVYLIDGMDKYTRQQRTKANRDWTNAIQTSLADNHPMLCSQKRAVNKEDEVWSKMVSGAVLEELLILLQLQEDAFSVIARTTTDRNSLVQAIVEQVAVLRYQQVKPYDVRAYTETGGVKCGRSERDAYSKILSSVPMVTEPCANVIGTAFPTLRRLWERFQFSAPLGSSNIVSQLEYTTGARPAPGGVVQSRSRRRVGGAVENKLRVMLTSLDPLDQVS